MKILTQNSSRFSLFFLLFILLIVAACKDEEEPKITAQEGIFINEVFASGEDWIELFNSNSASKDISNYKIYDDGGVKYSLPAGTTIPAGGFLVIICDDGNFDLHANFKLSEEGETVYLENSSGDVVDIFTYPALLNNQSFGRFPDGSSDLKASGSATRGESNGSSNAPTILTVSRNPLVPGLAQSVTINAEVAATPQVASMKLFYRFNGGTYTTVDMTISGVTFSGTIPAMNATGTVEYYVEALTGNGERSLRPADALTDPYRYLLNTDILPQLVINEFMALNTSCCPDDDSGTDEFNDWIEIYNAGSVAVDIGGFYLSDDVTNPFNSKIQTTSPTTTTIQPGGYLIVWADGQRDQGELHVDFQLNQLGEAVGLYYKDGRKIDEYVFGAQAENKSMGRFPSGSESFQVLANPSQGAAN